MLGPVAGLALVHELLLGSFLTHQVLGILDNLKGSIGLSCLSKKGFCTHLHLPLLVHGLVGFHVLKRKVLHQARYFSIGDLFAQEVCDSKKKVT